MVTEFGFGDHRIEACQNFDECAIGIAGEERKPHGKLDFHKGVPIVVLLKVFDVVFELVGQVHQFPLDELFEHEDIVFDRDVIQAVDVAAKVP